MKQLKGFRFFIAGFILLFLHCPISAAVGQTVSPAVNDAVILMYHNVADDTPSSTSVTPERFKQHMDYLSDNGYTVWPLFKTLVYLSTGRAIPAKTVVLTFDDAYQSVYSEAFPLLKEKGWPFTVFVTTQYIAEGYVNFMSWQQLREIQRYGGEIGNHSLTHRHLVRHRSDESKQQWRERITREVEQAQFVLQQNITHPVRAVAYPYGEYSKELAGLIRELGYFGLGQQSGAVSTTSDFQRLPRFPMATGFDGLDDFAIKVAVKNLPVTVFSPDDGIVSKDTKIPVLIMRLEPGNYKKSGLRCYTSGQGQIRVDWIDQENSVVSVRANEAISPGRVKYNCTAPSKSEAGVFYWFSYLWMKPETDGRWYRE